MNKKVLITVLILTMLFLSACNINSTDKEPLDQKLDYYNEHTCKLTQECESRCNAVEINKSMFCDYVCMEKKYCKETQE